MNLFQISDRCVPGGVHRRPHVVRSNTDLSGGAAGSAESRDYVTVHERRTVDPTGRSAPIAARRPPPGSAAAQLAEAGTGCAPWHGWRPGQ